MALADKYALITGITGDFGKMTAFRLAECGYGLFGVHFDLENINDKIKDLKTELQKNQTDFKLFNLNATEPDNRQLVIANMQRYLGSDIKPDIFVYSLKYPAIGPIIDDIQSRQVSQRKIEATFDTMAHGFVYWVQDLFNAGMLLPGSKIIAVIENIENREHNGILIASYAALIEYVKQLSIELYDHRISVNAIFGNVDNPKIPGTFSLLSLDNNHYLTGQIFDMI
jgi:NAD(P)-dependent dehydrogenase (short-subunit alcohol dehydrogenase family)